VSGVLRFNNTKRRGVLWVFEDPSLLEYDAIWTGKSFRLFGEPRFFCVQCVNSQKREFWPHGPWRWRHFYTFGYCFTVSRKNPHGRTGNRTRDLMISSQKLWPLDHEAGHWTQSTCYNFFFNFYLKHFSL
jgi:hypothetical protein